MKKKENRRRSDPRRGKSLPRACKPCLLFVLQSHAILSVEIECTWVTLIANNLCHTTVRSGPVVFIHPKLLVLVRCAWFVNFAFSDKPPASCCIPHERTYLLPSSREREKKGEERRARKSHDQTTSRGNYCNKITECLPRF